MKINAILNSVQKQKNTKQNDKLKNMSKLAMQVNYSNNSTRLNFCGAHQGMIKENQNNK